MLLQSYYLISGKRLYLKKRRRDNCSGVVFHSGGHTFALQSTSNGWPKNLVVGDLLLPPRMIGSIIVLENAQYTLQSPHSITMMNANEQYYIYILSNRSRKLLYIGFTSDLTKRVFQHNNKLADGFTSKYNVNALVYYEVCESRESALAREKQLKGFLRQKKIALISEQNPEWLDLYDGLIP